MECIVDTKLRCQKNTCLRRGGGGGRLTDCNRGRVRKKDPNDFIYQYFNFALRILY